MVEPKDPIDDYDTSHGKPGADHEQRTPDEQWGENLNPVRDTALPAKNLKAVGS